MLFFLTFYSSKNQRKSVTGSKTFLSSTTVSTLIRNQYIRMISGGSCDTEDWSNDAENSALRHINKLYFKVNYNRKSILEIAIIFHNITVFLYF